MKTDNFLKELHLGRLIKEIANQQDISASKLERAFIPRRYKQNADKIFKLDDLDIEDAIRVFNLLESNLLEKISNKFLSHILFTGNNIKHEYHSITLHFSTNEFTIKRNEQTNDYWANFHIGQYIKEMVQKRGWSQRTLAKRFGCDQSLISYFFKHKSLKIKPLIRFSNILYYNLIAEIYLIRQQIIPSLQHLHDSIIKLYMKQQRTEAVEKGRFTITFNTSGQSK